jgi:hypothetical protein
LTAQQKVGRKEPFLDEYYLSALEKKSKDVPVDQPSTVVEECRHLKASGRLVRTARWEGKIDVRPRHGKVP